MQMRRRLALILVVLLAVALPGCISVTGTIKLAKNQAGQWEAVEVTVPQEGITASGLKSLEDFFNGR
jgi:hypothetical protein